HREGGYFKECILGENIDSKDIPRNRYSSIYFLLCKGEISHLHRLDCDEVWYFHDGNPLSIYMISPEGELTIVKLGLDIEKGQMPQLVVPKGYWFGACMEEEDFSLVGCMCSPSFRYEKFELMTKEILEKEFPHIKNIDHFLI
ncbi:MAG: cupin domain-containing protein, partial [Butyrivibrio sp.]|nr:cupin domain-containing protein [Butyrivibrio sp.]